MIAPAPTPHVVIHPLNMEHRAVVIDARAANAPQEVIIWLQDGTLMRVDPRAQTITLRLSNGRAVTYAINKGTH